MLNRLAPVITEGRVGKIAGISLDITELEEEKLWAEALFENSTSAIALMDKDGKIKKINDTFAQTFGYELSEIKGINLDDVLEKGRRGSADREKTEKVLEGKSLEFEARRYDKEGNPHEFIIKGIPVKLENEIKGIYDIFDDITESKIRQKKLEAIFEASKNVAFVVAGPEEGDFLVKEFSPGAENIFGYRVEEIKEKPVSLLHPEATKAVSGQDIEEVLNLADKKM